MQNQIIQSSNETTRATGKKFGSDRLEKFKGAMNGRYEITHTHPTSPCGWQLLSSVVDEETAAVAVVVAMMIQEDDSMARCKYPNGQNRRGCHGTLVNGLAARISWKS
jgi:hypothetical protein